jgi:hypothetical protein
MSNLRPDEPKRTCTAHRRNGLACKGSPIRGTKVCRLHGGNAPQVREAARRRILAAADPVAARLIQIALDPHTETQHALVAIRDLLNRAGIIAEPAAQEDSGTGQLLWDEFTQIHRKRVGVPAE